MLLLGLTLLMHSLKTNKIGLLFCHSHIVWPQLELELGLEAQLGKVTNKKLEKTLTVANVKVKIESFIK